MVVEDGLIEVVKVRIPPLYCIVIILVVVLDLESEEVSLDLHKRSGPIFINFYGERFVALW